MTVTVQQTASKQLKQSQISKATCHIKSWRQMAYPKFQPAQPNALRTLNRKYSGLGGSIQTKFAMNRVSKWTATAWELAYKFGKRTTIHGMNRLFGETSGKYERSIWLITLVLAFLGSIYVCLILSKRFNEGKFQTVIDSTRAPVYRIYFPVITICNLNRLNWERIEAAKARFLPNETSIERLQLFERIISTYDDLRFANFDAFDVLQNEPVYLLNAVNFSNVYDFMTWRCEEFLRDCVWNHEKMNCCSIFSKRRTRSGLCWAFNTLETDEGRLMQRMDSMYPWHTGTSGPGNGLQVRVLINPEKHFPNRTNAKGLSVMVSEPNVWHREHLIIPANTKTLIEIDPIIFFYDNDTKSVPSAQRECVFDNERNSEDFKTLYGYIYMIENCIAQCHQEYLIQYCNCTVELLFPPNPFPSCKVTDLLCLAKNNVHFRYSEQPDEHQYVRNAFKGMVCKCFRNCYSLNYIADARPSFLPLEIRGNLSYVDLDAHYRFDTMMVYRTSLVFGWVDLIVAFGGIAGLFLGCSLISAMELAYFTFIDLPHFVMEKRKASAQLEASGLSNLQKFGIKNRITAINQHNKNVINVKQSEQAWNRFVVATPATIKSNF